MDLVQDWSAYFLDPSNPLRPWAYRLLSLSNTARSYVFPLLTSITQKPDLATIALLLVIIFVSLKLLNMLVQSVMFWFRLAWKIAFWGMLAGLALWMWTRGPEGVAQDVGYWAGVWGNEYEYWREREGQARAAQSWQQPVRKAQRRGGWGI
ncbi:hypothetical protein B0A48_02815 [Cryoendolithus antarcticus]|uniref:Uncharacterized protein n=1 Tax=Cryoendolithus antarcticus TaxID=1507870 RepID=A0A1V8TLJ4_9PEZI|nr:hypothetical protein B0A48_02815 [Cryoendolithus antarcticus]